MITETVKTLEEALIKWPKIKLGNAIDLTNQKFNYLTFLYKTEPVNTEVRWVAKCDCGNYLKIKPNNVKNGHTKSCGCLRKKISSKLNRKNLENLIFGFLTVIEDSGKRNNQRNIIWKCKCNHCGSFCYIPTSRLLNGDTRSCGCVKSMGESIIKQILNNKQINYKTEYYFKNLKLKQYLKFDFGLLDNKNNLLALIEFLGRLHYDNNIQRNFGKLEREITDPMKKEYCLNNNIKLYEIKYNENIKDNINKILKEVYNL